MPSAVSLTCWIGAMPPILSSKVLVVFGFIAAVKIAVKTNIALYKIDTSGAVPILQL